MSATQFDLSVLTLALTTADAHASAFDALTSEMVQWHATGVYPERAALIAAIQAAGRTIGTAKVYASRVLAWARAGKTPRSMHECIADGPKVTGKGGRPKGTAKTPVAKPAAGDDDTEGDPINPAIGTAALPQQWQVILQTMQAQVPARKDWPSEDIVAFQDSLSKCIALIKRNVK